MTICEWCGSGMSGGNCSRCGAPSMKKSSAGGYKEGIHPEGQCLCGKPINYGKVESYMIPKVICHGCYTLFAVNFNAEYSHDRLYANGRLTHVYASSGFHCPNCHLVFNYHEFYHGIYQDIEDEAFVQAARAAHESEWAV